MFVLQQESSENGFDVQGFVLRPLSVQQRIRELNLRARHFAETVLAVQLQDGYDRPPTTNQYGHAISLQVIILPESVYHKIRQILNDLR